MKKIIDNVKEWGTKKKAIIGVSTCVVITLIVTGVVMLTKPSAPSIELKKEEFTIEYGEQVSEEAKDYVTADKDILDKTAISFKNVEYEVSKTNTDKNNKYLKVGTYTATAIYKDENLNFTIVVKDTTAPEFVDFKETIEVEQDTTEDLSVKFKSEDLSEVIVKVDMEKLDLAKPGEYKTKVTATDEYANETVKDVTIVVKEKATTEETDTQTSDGSTSGTTGGSANNSGSNVDSNVGGTNTTPNNPTPAPAEAIVQLTPTPQPSFIFDSWDEAWNYGTEITGSIAKSQALAQEYGYRDIADTSSFVVVDVSFGYASSGIEVYSKAVVYFNFVK